MNTLLWESSERFYLDWIQDKTKTLPTDRAIIHPTFAHVNPKINNKTKKC